MRIFALAIVSLFLVAAKWAPPSDYSFSKPEICPQKKASIYNVCDDQMKNFNDALAKAEKSEKLLLVKFGATWCSWCVSMHDMIPSKDVLGYEKDKLKYGEKFEFLEVGTSARGKEGHLKIQSGGAVLNHVLNQVGKTKKEAVKGVPFLAVIDPKDPKKTVLRNTADLEDNSKSKSHFPEKIRGFLAEAHGQLTKP